MEIFQGLTFVLVLGTDVKDIRLYNITFSDIRSSLVVRRELPNFNIT